MISALTECRGGEASVDLDLVGALAGFPQIALQLQPQPSIGCAAEHLFQSYRHIGRNPGMAVQQVRERLARDAKGLGRRGYGKTKRFEALLTDNFCRGARDRASPCRYLSVPAA